MLHIKGAKERALLALLLLDANQLVLGDRIVDELWGKDAPHNAKSSLHVRVSNLRKALASTSEPAGRDLLVSRSGGYSILVRPHQLDLHRFDRLFAEAEDAFARHELARAADKLSDALGLWRGAALADFAYEGFAQIPAARLEELRLVALERRIDADLELGRHTRLIGELEELVALHPLRERLHGQLMLALYRAGRQAEALAAYRTARLTMVETLGIEPSPQIQHLERSILRQDPTLDLAGVPTADRSILIAVIQGEALESLLGLGTALARRPGNELILIRPVTPGSDVASASALVNKQRTSLLGQGFAVRAASFMSAKPADELVRIADEQDVDLLLLDGSPEILDAHVIRDALERSPCDVAVLIARHHPPSPGAVLVPFAGTAHDWAAVELAAWIATVWHSPLRLAGAAVDPATGSDASRLLAQAALAVQQCVGVTTEPVLLSPTASELVRAAEDAKLVVLGLPERWRREGLGQARLDVARNATPATLIVRRGPRPGGLAPRESRTRFTWSLGQGRQ